MRKRVAETVMAFFLLALILVAWCLYPRSAVINWTELHQVIDGFGGSCAYFREPLSSEVSDFFFTTLGIGLSLLRIQVVPSVEDCNAQFGRYGAECVDVAAGATILKGELDTAKQAVVRGVTVWSTPWSPPASMKSNHSFTNGGRLLPAYYSAWAESLAGYVKLLETNGVPIYAMSVQNEPNLTTDYGSAVFTAQELHDFIPYLHSALESAGAGKTKIMVAEASGWNFGLVSAAMADAEVANYVGIVAAHGYGPYAAHGLGPMKIYAPANYGKHVWLTEVSSPSAIYDGSMKDALSWALKIHKFLTIANISAWHWWFLSDGPKYGNGTDNSALTDINLNYPKRTYITGQWSRFVRPGWQRIGVSYSGPLEISAFKDPADHAFAIVVVNSGWLPVTQDFVLDGFSTDFVTPWITSANQSLAAQPTLSVRGSKFTYKLPAKCVATFSGAVQERSRS
jgi:glucuronoarabinoxylan endo-1,4-beta-xylanase